jgi:ubiquinone/menaquinone biosynthesis C-methylase UbiE
MKEQILEPILRRARVARALPVVRKYPECVMLDIGCGWEARLLRSLEPYVARGVGIDRKAPPLNSDKLTIIRAELGAKLPFDDESFDVVSMLAVLEHLEDPLGMLKEIKRVLRPVGALVITVPSHAAKPVLEFLAFRMKVVSAAEIADHKRYFGKADLKAISAEAGLRMVQHKYFQCGFNNFAVFSRMPAYRANAG